MAKHWPDAERFEDVRSVTAKDFPGADLICGGFPCQDISVAGNGAGLDGERSSLWWEYGRLVSEILPDYVVVENVPVLNRRGLVRVLGHFAACGYDAEWDIISAASVGASHRRDRMFIIARLRDVTDSNRSPLRNRAKWKTRRRNNIQAKREAESMDNGSPRNVTDSNRGGCQIIGNTQHKELKSARRSESNGLGPERRGNRPELDLNPWQTLTEICPVDDGVSGRVAMLRALGNAVVPQVAYQVGLRINELRGNQ